jgi:hypothetical protein
MLAVTTSRTKVGDPEQGKTSYKGVNGINGFLISTQPNS